MLNLLENLFQNQINNAVRPSVCFWFSFFLSVFPFPFLGVCVGRMDFMWLLALLDIMMHPVCCVKARLPVACLLCRCLCHAPHLLPPVVRPQLNNAIQGAVQQMLDNLGKQVQSVNLDIPFTNWGIEGMFGLTANPTITSKYIGMDCLGVVANTKHPVKPPTGVTPPHVPSFSSGAADHYVQLGISTYFFETLAWVYQQAGQLKSIITHSEVPSSVALQLNTSSLSVFAPGLDSKYPNMWCQLDAGVVAPVNVDTSQAMVAVAPFEIAVQPVTASGPETAFTVGCNLTVGLALHVEQGSPQKLAGNFTFLSCPLATVSSKVGSVKVSGLNMLINTIVTETLLPLVNKVLEAGFPMPTMDGLTLTNSEVLEVDNAIIVASDFTLKLQG